MSPIGAFCSGVPVLNRTSWPCLASEQQVTNSTPLALASEIDFPSVVTSAALRMIALVPFRTAAWIAFWTFSGEPSVPTWLTDQPSVFAPCCRIGPWTAQASTPQLMKVIFLPVGIGFLIGVVCVIAVGRALYLASNCWRRTQTNSTSWPSPTRRCCCYYRCCRSPRPAARSRRARPWERVSRGAVWAFAAVG